MLTKLYKERVSTHDNPDDHPPEQVMLPHSYNDTTYQKCQAQNRYTMP